MECQVSICMKIYFFSSVLKCNCKVFLNKFVNLLERQHSRKIFHPLIYFPKGNNAWISLWLFPWLDRTQVYELSYAASSGALSGSSIESGTARTCKLTLLSYCLPTVPPCQPHMYYDLMDRSYETDILLWLVWFKLYIFISCL